MTWLERQSFLGEDSDAILESMTVGLVGLGGGNSHVAQQLAHLGVGGFVLVDDDKIALSNLNRLVGGTRLDVKHQTPKVDIAERIIFAVNPKARIIKREAIWQTVSDVLKSCDVIIGGVDKVRAKDELDGFCRRFLIPYIDQGMDVHQISPGNYLVAGQVILSSPGGPCLRCLGLVTDEALAREAQRYGDAGSNPQVVWPNGVLASTTVGLFVQLVTPWHRNPVESAYLEYDANQNTMIVSDRLRRRLDKPCAHHDPKDLGDPMFDMRQVREPVPVTALSSVPASEGKVRRVSWIARLIDWVFKRKAD